MPLFSVFFFPNTRPMFKIIEMDLGSISNEPQVQVNTSQDQFLQFCQSVADVDERHTLQVFGVYATGQSGLDLNQKNCALIFRFIASSRLLRINNEDLVKISPLKFFNHLVELDLKGNQISDVNSLSKMANMRKHILPLREVLNAHVLPPA